MKNGLLLRYALLALALLPATVLSADQPKIRLWPNGAPDSELYAQARGEVEITASADREQPSGWPIVVELTLTNVGKEPIRWWCGGPDLYPGAEHFIVQVRQGVGDDWRDVKPTNGQYVEGSGIDRQLKPGESITVPLALPVEKKNESSFRILPHEWRADKFAEVSILFSDDPGYADRRRARVIEGALGQGDPFWRHIAQRYADAAVIEAMLSS